MVGIGCISIWIENNCNHGWKCALNKDTEIIV